ncbi:50S ribosomal protein L14 [Candidatus Shikimatogenerans silvanidophilus]|uniref:50S ribosomal protein L14 n=1 Tax=Candidatus Shikimatogenerans silvanidophilus TaxID=2782547 RepID=UPI001BAAE774|nr:50S ribosomal protein L14 [Candidatus Shikimatogenerans silvanidophilus]
MLQQESVIKVADNTGAKKAMIIRVLGGTGKKYASLGDKVVVSIKNSIPGGTIKKGQTSKAVIIRTKKKIKRKDGSYIGFDDNACILINDNGDIKGTRVFGPISREIKEENYTKIVSLAKEVI